MTLQEARKVIGLNILKLNGSMQLAVAMIMDEVEKVQAVKEVLEQRRGCCEQAIEYCKKKRRKCDWIKGKLCGYDDARDLLNSSVKSIRVELL